MRQTLKKQEPKQKQLDLSCFQKIIQMLFKTEETKQYTHDNIINTKNSHITREIHGSYTVSNCN